MNCLALNVTLMMALLSPSALGRQSGDAPPSEAPPSDAPPPDAPQRSPRERGQGQGRPQPMTAEQLAPAWKAQAGHVAGELALDAEPGAALIAAYVDARTAHHEAVEKARQELIEQARAAEPPAEAEDNDDEAAGAGEAGRRGGGRGAAFMEKLRQRQQALLAEHRAALQQKVAGELTAEQTEKAIDALGQFDRGWDSLTTVLVEFKLPDETMHRAMDAIDPYLAEVAKAREVEDREAMREALVAARQKLSQDMKDILDDEQWRRFQRTLGGGRGEGRGMGGRGEAGRGEGRGEGRQRGGTPPDDASDA